MATVYYGMAGEGRGHAMRAQTIIEHLRQDHEVVVLTFGQALEMLRPIYEEPRYGGNQVSVRDIGGMYLEYDWRGRMSPTKTLLRGLPYALRMPKLVRALREELERKNAALVITDFEPVSMRAAIQANVPVVSIDHQRYLEACDLGDLPWLHRLKIWAMNFVIRCIYGTPNQMVVSGFHLPKLKPEFGHVHSVGVLLRDEIKHAAVSEGNHLVVYLRRNCPEHVLHVLEQLGQDVHVYGLGAQPSRGRVQFRQVSPTDFARDLASCRALITTAGNQLIGEALFMKKPVLAFPEPGNFEQQINGAMLNETGGGRAIRHSKFALEVLHDFLDQVPAYRDRIDTQAITGNERVFQVLDSLLVASGRRLPVGALVAAGGGHGRPTRRPATTLRTI